MQLDALLSSTKARQVTMKLLTLEEMAAQLHWSPGTARNRISRGEPMPPHLKIGHRLLFPATDFEKWVESHIVQAESESKVVKSNKKSKLGRPRSESSGSLT